MTTRRKKALLDKLQGNEKEKVVDEEIAGDTPTSSCQSTKSLRGRTVMHCLSIQRVQGVRKDVEFNRLGQPIGPVASQMQSYIGVLAREKVKITYESWKDVPNEVNDQIWESVNLSFNVDPKWRGGCLVSANLKWRQFKTKLTNEFVYKRIGTPDLNTPPAQYPCIEAQDWSSFVISRLSDDFKKLRTENKEMRAKYVYPYRLSRLGYAQYAETHPHILTEDPEINQATLWVEARKTKDGNCEGETLKEKVFKIDEFISKKKEGSLSFEGNKNTNLEEVLGSEEHHGRLRGVGGHITSRSYYKTPGGIKSKRDGLYDLQQRELNEEIKKNAEQDEQITRLEAALIKFIGPGVDADEKCSCSVKCKPGFTDEVQPEHANSPTPVHYPPDVCNFEEDDMQFVEHTVDLQGKFVALSLESGTNIAAYGTIVKVNGPNELIHGMQMPENCTRVSIDEAVDENAPLPIPTHECLSIGDAVGSHVAWPMHLMKL